MNIDDIGLTPYLCDPPIDCDFKYNTCGWQANTKLSYAWNLGIGRVEDPKQLKFKEQFQFQLMYSDFTNSYSDIDTSMELLSEYISPVAKDACFVLMFIAKTFDVQKDLFELAIVSFQGLLQILFD